MNREAVLPFGTKVVVSNNALKTFGKVFTVCSYFVGHNRYGWTVEVKGHGLYFTINKSNIQLYKEAEIPAPTPLPELVVEQPEMEYRVVNSHNNILKEVFKTVDDAVAAIKKWSGGMNNETTFQVLSVVKTYKARRELILEEVE